MYDCEVAKFYQWSEPVARKEYACAECSATIRKGEKYFHVRMKFDGQFFVERQHLLCCEACMWIRDNLDEGCVPFGRLQDYCREMRLDIRESAKLGNEDAQKLRSTLAKILRRECAEQAWLQGF